MANKGKPCAFLLILFLCLASFITVKALDKSDSTLSKCIKSCQRKYPQSPEERDIGLVSSIARALNCSTALSADNSA